MNPRVVIELDTEGVVSAVYGNMKDLEVRVHQEFHATDFDPPEPDVSFDPKFVSEVFNCEH